MPEMPNFVLFFSKYSYPGQTPMGWVAPWHLTFPEMAQMQDAMNKPV